MKKFFTLILFFIVFTLLQSVTTVFAFTYDFDADTIGLTPQNVLVQNGTLITGTTTNMSGKAIHFTSGIDPANATFYNLPVASDYSVIWKGVSVQNWNRNGILLRAQPTPYSGYNSGSKTRSGYFFFTSIYSNQLRIYKFSPAGAATLANVSLTPPPANTPRWYKADATGSLLTFSYSDTSASGPWTVTATSSDTTYSAGYTSYLEGFGIENGYGWIDDVTQNIMTTGNVAPDQMSAPTAVAGFLSATVSFTEPTLTGGSVISYYTAISSPGGFSATSTGSPVVVSGLSSSTPYTFKVTATNIYGLTSTSSASSNSVTPTSTPSVPTSLVVSTVSTSTLTLSWIASSGATAYQVSANNGFATTTTAATTINLSSLNPNTSYTFNLSAYNSAGTSTSTTLSTTTSRWSVPSQVSAAPTTSDVAGTYLTLSWAAPADNGNSIDYYIINSSPFISIATTSATTTTVNGLATSTSYTFTVAAHNIVGLGSTSPSSIATTTGIEPDAPVITSVTTSNGGAKVFFSTPENHGSPITNYIVTASPGNINASNSESPVSFNRLTNGITYTFTAVAVNGFGTSSLSNSISSKLAVTSRRRITIIDQPTIAVVTATEEIPKVDNFVVGNSGRTVTPIVANIISSSTASISTISTTTNEISSNNAILQGNLYIGMSGDEVKKLQQILITKKIGPAAKELAKVGVTKYFGKLTKAAVIELQKSKGIVPAVGYVGTTTRGALKKIF